MSLIDEALKRAQAAQGGAARPEATRRPWTPVPLPDRSRIRRRKILRASLLVVIALLVAGGTFFLFRRTPEMALSFAAGKGPAEGRGLPSEASAKEGEGRASTTTAPSRPTRAPRNRAAAPPAHPGSPASAPSAASPPPAAVSERPAALVNGKTYIGPVALPGGGRLDLGGIAYSESNATVLLNGKIVGMGATVEGFTISRIEENRIELQGGGVTIFVALR